ncbi:GntR family transcriptional regulator [Carnobacterium sp. CS13]|nr:GntR family transcriptional regulator [Carnobacterium sp. CS13]
MKKKYDVSSTTVVRALQELVLEGFLIRRQGEGTFVRKYSKHKKVFFNEEIPIFKTYSDEIKQGTREGIKTLFIKDIKDEDIAKKLRLSSKEETIVHFCRIAYLNDVPWSFKNSYIAKDRISNIDYKNETAYSSLSEMLKKEMNINLLQLPMEETIVVEHPVNEEIAEDLKIDKNSPIIHVKKISYYPDGYPFEYSDSYMNHHYYSVRIKTDSAFE